MIDLTWEFLESWRVAKDDGKVRTSQITPVEPRKTCIFLYNKLSFYKYKVSRSIQKCQNIPAGTRYLQIGNKKCPDERPDKVPDWHKITGVVRARLALSAFHNSPDIFQPQPENARPGQSPFSLGFSAEAYILRWIKHVTWPNFTTLAYVDEKKAEAEKIGGGGWEWLLNGENGCFRGEIIYQRLKIDGGARKWEVWIIVVVLKATRAQGSV